VQRACVVLCLVALRPAAQEPPKRYHLMIGATLNSIHPFDSDVGTHVGPGILLRGVPRQGFGPVIDASATSLGLERSATGQDLGTFKMRAVILGIGYTIEKGRLATTFHTSAGYSFNKAETLPEIVDQQHVAFEAHNAFLFRGGVTFTWSAGARWAFVSSAGVLLMQPDVRLNFQDAAGQTTRTETGTWKVNGLVWEVGVAFKIF
jgi:hypothetical protein